MVRSITLLLACRAFSSSDLVSASGTVYDLADHPLQGVVVQLESDTTLKATSALDGTWAMENPFSSLRISRPLGDVRIEGGEMVVVAPKAGLLRLEALGIDGSTLFASSKRVQAGETRMHLPTRAAQTQVLRLRLDNTTLFSGNAGTIRKSDPPAAARPQLPVVDHLIYTQNGQVRAKGELRSWKESGIVQRLDTSSASCVGDILFGPRSAISTSYEASNGGSWSKIDVGLAITTTPTRTCDSIVSPISIAVVTTTITPTPGIKGAMADIDNTVYFRDSVRSRGVRGAPGLASPIQFRRLSGNKQTINYKSMQIDVSPEGYLGRNGTYLTLEASKMSKLVLNNVEVNLDTLNALVKEAIQPVGSASP